MRISAFLNRVRILAFLIFKLAARRRNVATTRISHGCFDARAFKRSNECIDAMFGGGLKRRARNIIEGQQIHVGGNALAEIDERLQVVVIVVEGEGDGEGAVASGLNVFALVPLVMPFSTAHRTAV